MSNLMSDAVMVPRAEMKFAIAQAIWEIDRNESTAARTLMVAAQNLLTAASPPVGGWEDMIGTGAFLLDRLADFERTVESESGDAAVNDWHGHVVPAIARFRSALSAPPPPSVSTGSRPQEAVPTEGHDAAVVTPEDWWIDWPGGARPVDRYTLVTIRRRDGREVCDKAFKFDWTNENYVGTQSDIVAYRVEAVTLADGCSSNEGAGQ